MSVQREGERTPYPVVTVCNWSQTLLLRASRLYCDRVAEERPFAGPGTGRSLDSPVPSARHRMGRQGAASVPLPRLDLAALIDLLPDAIVVAGTTGHIRLANAAAGRLY